MESEPEALRTPAGIFSSRYWTQARTISIIYDTQKLRSIIAQSLIDSTDALSVTQASRLVGYSESTVSKWVVSGRLRSFRGIHGRIIAMEDLIDYMASYYATKIAVKSAIHQGWFDKYNQLSQ
ncbi:MAG: helix-turn-helix domain-containing protein [Acetanaerobacterium sp.]